MATSYVAHIYNHMPSDEDIAPSDIFTETKFTHHKIKYIHVWGYTVYVLDPTLQQGRKIPEWKPRSHRGIFVGFSTNHSSDFPLILNPNIGHISSHFHVIFDDYFSTFFSLSPYE